MISAADQWRAFAPTAPVLEHRRQSLATMAGMQLKPIPLRAPTNHNETGRVPNISDWNLIDTFQNYGCPLVGDWLDLDIDVRPLGNIDDPKNYPPEFYAAATDVIRTFQMALDAAGLRTLSFGRQSMGGYGHAIVAVKQLKADEDLVRLLTMSRYVPMTVGDVGLKFRLEVRRRASKQDSAKNWTLPGSVYERRDGRGLDLIVWSMLVPGLRDILPPPELQELSVLHRGIYMGLLALAVLPHWNESGRHDLALHVSGAMAHDIQIGRLTEEDAERCMQFLVDESEDTEGRDRLNTLKDSIARMAQGKEVTGYRTLAETVGQEWIAALRRLCGGGDPDTYGTLRHNVVRIRKGMDKNDCYIDLSAGPGNYVELSLGQVKLRFSNRPEYPKILDRRGQMMEPIYALLNSDRQRTYDGAVRLPGVTFGTLHWHHPDKGMQLTEITEAAPAADGHHVYINVAAGFAHERYPEGEFPDPLVLEEALDYLHNLLGPLTSNTEDGLEKLKQVVAWKIQRPREKQQIGVALAGGGDIGKSFFLSYVLASIVGPPLVGDTTVKLLEDKHRLSDVDKYLFYYIDECKFGKLSDDILQFFKHIMRNRNLEVDAKYGARRHIENVAIPFFLSNDPDPALITEGQRDRALLVIKGDTQSSLNFTQAEWADYAAERKAFCDRFIKVLEREEIRRALYHHFATYPLSPAIFTVNSATGSSESMYERLSILEQCLCDAFEAGYIFPVYKGLQGPRVDGPALVDTWIRGLTYRARQKGSRTENISLQTITKALYSLLQEEPPARDDIVKLKPEDRQGVLRSVRYHREGRAYTMRYLRDSLGACIRRIKEVRGIEILNTTAEALKICKNPEPDKVDKAELAKAYDFETQMSGTADFGKYSS